MLLNYLLFKNKEFIQCKQPDILFSDEFKNRIKASKDFKLVFHSKSILELEYNNDLNTLKTLFPTFCIKCKSLITLDKKGIDVTFNFPSTTLLFYFIGVIIALVVYLIDKATAESILGISNTFIPLGAILFLYIILLINFTILMPICKEKLEKIICK